ncbi:MAG: ArgE/DapE family deacylase [Candidatus Lokiarchaeota archaeon]|nr:ArgE/DapE family deacylase [Candidatus Lokiarchaeota archaeon]
MISLENLFEEVDKIDKQTIMSLITTLCSIDTTVPPGNSYREYIDAICPIFEELGYTLEEVILPNNLINQIPYNIEGSRINLVATKDFGQKQEVSFFGHMDVVPAVDQGDDKWKFPPFKPTLKGGKIFGRGVGDNKGAMVCLILALRIIKDFNIVPNYNINVLSCTDEELGFYPGARYLAEKGYAKGAIFCMDFSVDPILLMGSAGNLDVEIETIGRSSHSGLSFMGVNALEAMVPILVELLKLKKNVESRQSKDIPGFPDSIVAQKKNLTPLLNLDVIKAGQKSNIIPGICHLIINRRIIPDEKYEDVKKEILDAIERGKEKSNALDVKVRFDYSYPSFKVDINSPDVQKIKNIIIKVHNIPENKIRKQGMAITFDVGFVAQLLNTQNIIIRGVTYGGSNTHGVNENIRIKDMKKFIKEILAFLCGDF